MPSPVIKVNLEPQFKIAEESINAKHLQLGGDGGFLGAIKPDTIMRPGGTTGILKACSDKKGFFKIYQHGVIYWFPAIGAYEVHGSILEKWSSLGFEKSALGYPIEDEKGTLDGVGRYNRFQNGMIYWTPAIGAHEIHGDILSKWASMGMERGLLGYPIDDEKQTIDGVGRYSHFQNGNIYWTPSTGAHDIRGAILEKWSSMGFEKSFLGYPIWDQTSGISRFQRGLIQEIAGHTIVIPDSVHLHENIQFPDGIAITAHCDILISSNGAISFSLYAHDSTILETYDYGVVIIVMTPDGTAYTIQHQGHVNHSENDTPTININRSSVISNWDQIKLAKIITPIQTTSNSFFLGEGWEDFLDQLWKDLEAIGPIVKKVIKWIEKLTQSGDPDPNPNPDPNLPSNPFPDGE